MAIVRILVDGYSLLHSWPKLARGQPRHSAAAREQLIQLLTLYHDASGLPISVFFDGGGTRHGTANALSNREVEVLYSRAGQTADQLIERAVHRFASFGEVLVVTDDRAESETVLSLGGLASSCWNFIETVQRTLAQVREDIEHHNRHERHRFQHRE